MNYSQFVTKYLGRFVDYDKAYGFQCVDLMRQYIKEVQGLDSYKILPGASYAKQIFWNYQRDYPYKKIINTPTGVPTRGDIFFFQTYPFLFGVAGHVGIVDSADVNTVVLLNQNYPTGSSINLRKFSYKGALGWLHLV